jgi:ribonucleoside-diphosphate reductase alpha chain
MKDQIQDQMHLQGVDPLQDAKLYIRKRDGRIEEFNEARIFLAIECAFKAVRNASRDASLVESDQVAVKKCADRVVERVLARAVRGEQLEVEKIQDAVEEQLMREGHLIVARRYIQYREQRRLARAAREGRATVPSQESFCGKAALRLEPALFPVVVKPSFSQKSDNASGLLDKIYSQALPKPMRGNQRETDHAGQFGAYVREAQSLNHLAPEMLDYDLEKLAGTLRLERDGLFFGSGLQALHDDFLLRDDKGRRIETPQYFWMRVAMGLALNEGGQWDARAIEFYEALSTFRFVPSETIFCHAGAFAPQLAECGSSTSWSDLEHFTAHVGGRVAARRKKGLTCSWLEPWHMGVWSFLEHARPGEPAWEHDLNKALWIPDLFMKRLARQGPWTLFDPPEVPDLHQLFGRAFEERYVAYEKKAEQGGMQSFQRIRAADLWREILGSIHQTGQPWIGFKDTANIRSVQDHAGVVHGGGLSTAILFDTSDGRAVACVAGSINLAAHLTGDPADPLDLALLRGTVRSAVRMLDNAIDIGSHPFEAAKRTGLEHRPIAVGILGFQDALDRLKIDYASAAAADFADASTEMVAHAAILASSELARERGVYPGYAGSKWSQGLLPIDTVEQLSSERGTAVDMDAAGKQDWKEVREAVRRDGMRHCAVTAICPTDAGSRITGVSASIEPDICARPGKFRTAFEIAPQWLVECAARRQKWLDMGQTLNLYAAEDDLTLLSDVYTQAWEKGLKTVRQLRTPASPSGRSLAGKVFLSEAAPETILPRGVAPLFGTEPNWAG